jgi:hypothetical protein
MSALAVVDALTEPDALADVSLLVALLELLLLFALSDPLMPLDDWPESELPWLELPERSKLDDPALTPLRFASLVSLLAMEEF